MGLLCRKTRKANEVKKLKELGRFRDINQCSLCAHNVQRKSTMDCVLEQRMHKGPFGMLRCPENKAVLDKEVKPEQQGNIELVHLYHWRCITAVGAAKNTCSPLSPNVKA